MGASVQARSLELQAHGHDDQLVFLQELSLHTHAALLLLLQRLFNADCFPGLILDYVQPLVFCVAYNVLCSL